MRDSEEKKFERNSVWPTKLNFSDRIFFIYWSCNEASIPPEFKAFADAKSDFKAT